MRRGERKQKCIFAFGSARNVQLTRFVLPGSRADGPIDADDRDRSTDAPGPELVAHDSSDGNYREKAGNDLSLGLGRYQDPRHGPSRQFSLLSRSTRATRTEMRPFQLDDVQVISSNSYPSTSTVPAHHSITVGCSPRRVKTTSSALLGQFRSAGIEPKMRIAEFPVSEDAFAEPGESFSLIVTPD